MSTISIRLYDIFRKNLKLQEVEAKELVEVIQQAVEEKQADKLEHTEQMMQKDITLLKEHMDREFGYMKNYMDTRFATKTDLADTRAELVRWMFIFWIGQIAATFGFILLFLKK